MRLLIITQKVDYADDNLGFFHRWIEEFAKNTDKVAIIAQSMGKYSLPANVSVVSLGKERGFCKLRQLFNFYRALWREAPRADAVFVHMIPMWTVLGWPVYKIFNKKVYLWYVHKSVTLWLRFAEKMVAKIFTASKESCRLASQKIEITGHGIDTDYFKPRPELRSPYVYRIISVGRISAAKRIKEMILAVDALRGLLPDKKLEFAVIGGTRTEEDKQYLEELKKMVADRGLNDIVIFSGPKPYDRIAEEYQRSNLFLNFSLTGSIDKAVLEAISCGADVLVANEAFFGLLPRNCTLRNTTPFAVAEAMKFIIESIADDKTWRDAIRAKNNLKILISGLSSSMK